MLRYGLLEDFLSKWQKAKRDIHTYIQTYIHSYRLPLVVLSAAVAAKNRILVYSEMQGKSICTHYLQPYVRRYLLPLKKKMLMSC